MPSPRRNTALRLSALQQDALTALADAEGVTVSDVIRRAIDTELGLPSSGRGPRPATRRPEESVPCPRCHAAPGEACRKPSGERSLPHSGRWWAAKDAGMLDTDRNEPKGTP